MGLREELVKRGVWEVVIEFEASYDEVYDFGVLFMAADGSLLATDLPEEVVQEIFDDAAGGLPNDYMTGEGTEGTITFNLLEKDIKYDYRSYYQDSEPEQAVHAIFPEEDEPNKEDKAPLEQLKELGISKAVITYNGGGDSGAIEEILYYKSDGKEIRDREIPEDLDTAVHSFAIDVSLDNINWYDNDGGWGVITMDLAKNEATLEHNYRISKSRHQSYERPVESIFDFDNDDTEL